MYLSNAYPPKNKFHSKLEELFENLKIKSYLCLSLGTGNNLSAFSFHLKKKKVHICIVAKLFARKIFFKLIYQRIQNIIAVIYMSQFIEDHKRFVMA